MSNETEPSVNHCVPALNSLHHASLGGRHCLWIRAGNGRKPHSRPHRCRLAVRDASARRTAVGVHHYPPRIAPFVGRPHRSHAGQGRRRREPDGEHQRTLLLRVDAARARRDRVVRRHLISARTVESATGPVPVAQQPTPLGFPLPYPARPRHLACPPFFASNFVQPGRRGTDLFISFSVLRRSAPCYSGPSRLSSVAALPPPLRVSPLRR